MVSFFCKLYAIHLGAISSIYVYVISKKWAIKRLGKEFVKSLLQKPAKFYLKNGQISSLFELMRESYVGQRVCFWKIFKNVQY